MLKAFVAQFPENLREFVEKNFKILFIDEKAVYLKPAEDKEFMANNKEHFGLRSLKLKLKNAFGVENFIVVKDEKALFLEKAIEIANAKKIEIKISPM